MLVFTSDWLLVPGFYRVLATVILLVANISAQGQSVDLLTGRLQYGIPLGELKANDISIPIGISNHGNAVTVAEGGSDCGVGWSLSAGGSITRIVRGLPDELNDHRKGWIYSTKSPDIQSFTPQGGDSFATYTSGEEDDYEFLEELGYTNDTEPDLFYFQAPGIGGQFILDHDGVPQLLTLQDVTISNFDTTGFSIRTNNGFVYSFATKEQVVRTSMGETYNEYTNCKYNLGGAVWFTGRWLLTTMTSTATGTNASFYHESMPEAIVNTQGEDSLYVIQDRFLPMRLAEISLENYRVNIIYANRVISRVYFSETSSVNKKEFVLHYQTFLDKDFGEDVFPVSKAFLKSVRETGPDCNPFASYEFTYAGIDWNETYIAKPWENNWKQDWFGFFNGKSGNENDPTLYYYSGETHGRRMRVTPIPGGSPTTISGDDRSVDFDSLRFGSLTNISLPTGGTTEIEYESNTYYDRSTSEELTGGGLRVKTITSNGSEVAFGKATSVHSPYRALRKRYEYKAADTVGSVTSGKLIAPLKFGFIRVGATDFINKSATNMGDAPEILYSRVKEVIDSLGSTVYVFSVPATFPDTLSGEWKATKSRLARPSNVSAGNVKNGYYTYPFPPATNYNFKRGFLESVHQYDKEGTLVRKREMTPLQLPSSPPAAIKGIRFEKWDLNYYYGVYEMLTGRRQVIGKEVATEFSEASPTDSIRTVTVYTYNSNNMLEQVTDTLADLSVRKQKFRYAKDYTYTSPTTDTMAVALKTLNDTHRHGELVEHVTRLTPNGGSEVVTGAQLIVYKTFTNGKVLPHYLKTVRAGASVTESSVGGSQTFTSDADYYSARIFHEYDSAGRVLSEYDDKKNHVAHDYATDLGFETATYANARSGQVVYEGFEATTTSGLKKGGTPTYPAGWTGEKAIQIDAADSLTSAPLQKGGSKYRISCWVKAGQATNISFIAFHVEQQILTAPNPDDTVYVDVIDTTFTITSTASAQWEYFEKEVGMEQVPSSFQLRVMANNTVTIDDIVFMPISSRIAFQTVRTLYGVTSSSDDRGNSVVYKHDEQGRVVSTFDRKRNLVQKNEFANQKQLTSELVAGFLTGAYYRINEPIYFTALPNCLEVTHQWKIDNNIESTDDAFPFTFVTPGRHQVELTVTSGGLSKAFRETICVDLSAAIYISAAYTNSDPFPPGTVTDCNSPSTVFTVNGLPGGCSVSVSWVAMSMIWINNHYEPYPIGSLGTGTTLTYASRFEGAIVATISIDCGGTGNLQCLGERSTAFTLAYDVGYNPYATCH